MFQTPSQLVEVVQHGGKLLAILLSGTFREAGIHFLTPAELSQQMAYIRHPAGKTIEPHIHNPVPRSVSFTQEVLFVRAGRLRVDFYTDEQQYLESRILEAGDTILLATGGHGFEALTEIELIEVKQGPYAGENDKTRFTPKAPAELKIGGSFGGR